MNVRPLQVERLQGRRLHHYETLSYETGYGSEAIVDVIRRSWIPAG